jgi:peptidoglycan hydrolase-like protein with peptidoglycan-binding domain
MRTRRNTELAVRLTAYVDPATRTALREVAKNHGLTVGALLDRIVAGETTIEVT